MNIQVSTNPILTLIAFTLLVITLFYLIARWKWHVFLALLIPIVIFGIIPGIQQANFIEAFEEGFGKTLGKIGVVIVLGSVIAEGLKHTGANHHSKVGSFLYPQQSHRTLVAPG